MGNIKSNILNFMSSIENQYKHLLLNNSELHSQYNSVFIKIRNQEYLSPKDYSKIKNIYIQLKTKKHKS